MAENNGNESFFENKSQMMGAALILSLIAFFLLNFGVREVTWAYWLGLILVFGGLLLAPLSRFTAGKKGEEEEPEEGEQEKEEPE